MYTLLGRRGAGSLGPHLVLEELGVPYTFKHVEKEETKTPQFLRLNPMGRIPALILPSGEAMFESAAMVAYLTAAHPSALAPQPGTPAHARFMQWLVFLSANLYETYLRFFYSDRYTVDGAVGAGGVKTKALSDLHEQFAIIEDALSPNLLGEAISAADLYCYMLLTWWEPTPKDLYMRYPRIAALAGRIEARPAVKTVLAANAG